MGVLLFGFAWALPPLELENGIKKLESANITRKLLQNGAGQGGVKECISQNFTKFHKSFNFKCSSPKITKYINSTKWHMVPHSLTKKTRIPKDISLLKIQYFSMLSLKWEDLLDLEEVSVDSFPINISKSRLSGI